MMQTTAKPAGHACNLPPCKGLQLPSAYNHQCTCERCTPDNSMPYSYQPPACTASGKMAAAAPAALPAVRPRPHVLVLAHALNMPSCLSTHHHHHCCQGSTTHLHNNPPANRSGTTTNMCRNLPPGNTTQLFKVNPCLACHQASALSTH